MKIGTKIRIIETKNGCRGAEGKIGIVTNHLSNDGLLRGDDGYNVEIAPGNVWRINEDAKVEILPPTLKDLLKNGVFGVMSNGSKFVVVNDHIVYQHGTYESVKAFADEKKRSPYYIKALYDDISSFGGLSLAMDNVVSNKIIYSISEPVEMTISEIKKKLGIKNLKIVEE